MYELYTRAFGLIVPILLIFFLGLYMPKLVRREIFFGVRIPLDRLGTDSVRKIARWYRNNYLIMGGLLSLALIAVVLIEENPMIYTIGFFVVLIVQYALYYRARNQALLLKEQEQWFAGLSETVVVETASYKKFKLVSPFWFLIPIILLSICWILGAKNYHELPAKIPMQYDGAGQPVRWAEKSFMSAFFLPIIMTWMTGLLFFVYRLISWSRQELRAEDPEIALAQQTLFKRRWSGFMVFLNSMICGLMGFLYLQTLQMIEVSSSLKMGLPVGFTLLILAVTLILSFQTGQGGSRIRINLEGNKVSGAIDRKDDQYWKWGLFYFNPDDPAMFVEKRFGIGWTNNFGNWKANLIMLGILLAVLILVKISP